MISRKQKFSFVAVVLTATTAIWATQSYSGLKPGALFKPENQEIVTRGKDLYAVNCASCHGADLKGQPNWRSPGSDGLLPAPPHDKTGHTWHHIDDLLFNITKFGLAKITEQKDFKTSMPVYDGVLSDEEIIAVLSYIKSRWPKNIQDRHDQMNAQNVKVSK
jgi:mono/diheme cytochrome c family protein